MTNVAIFLPSRCSNVYGDLDTEGTGAREQIAAWLADEIELNTSHDIHVFTAQQKPVHSGRQHWVDHEMAAPMLSTYDWEAVVSFDYPAIATLPGIKDRVKKVVVSQNYFYLPDNADCPGEYYENIDTFVYPSNWAANECPKFTSAGALPSVVIPYTWDPAFFGNDSPEDKHAPRYLYANQAESGLAQMLRMWPQILAEQPEARLTVAVDVQQFVDQIQWSHHYQAVLALDIRDLMDQPGVRYIGRQGRLRLGQEMRAADYLLYPNEPLMQSETGSLPMIQAAACGCIPMFYAVDALEELYSDIGVSIGRKNVDDMVDFVLDPPAPGFCPIPDSRFPVNTFDAWREVLGC